MRRRGLGPRRRRSGGVVDVWGVARDHGTHGRVDPNRVRDQPVRVMHVFTRFRRGGSERRIRDIVAAVPEFDHTVMVGPDSDLDLARAQLAPAT